MNTVVETAIAPLQAAAAQPAAPARISEATVQKLGPDGRQVAEEVAVNYAQARLDDDGQVVGGSVSLVSKFQNVTRTTSTVQFSSEGRAAGASTTLYDRIAGGVFRAIESDLSGLHLLQGHVIDGALSFRSRRPDGALVSTGSITFAKEQPSHADIETQAPDGSGGLTRRTRLDFSATRFLGTEIVGGTVHMQSRRAADDHLLVESNTAYGPRGLPQQVSMKVYGEANASPRATVELDFANVSFNALKEIESGTLAITARRPDGAIVCKGQLGYQGTLPATYSAEAYDRRGAVARRIAIDYSGIRFNQARRPISSALAIRIADAGGNPVSATTVEYGAHGLPIRRQTRAGAGQPGSAEILSEVDCRRAVYDARGVIVGGQTTTTAVTGGTQVKVVRSFAGMRHCAVKERSVSDAGAPTPRKWSKTYYRPDGTALKLVTVVRGPNGQPQTGSVTSFATDGRTVLSRRSIDYSKLTYTAGVVSGGTIAMATLDGAGRPRSNSTVRLG